MTMTTAATIAALEALTADVLQSADDAQLARLEELVTALATLIDNEKERRNPTDKESDATSNDALERAMEITRQLDEKHMDEYRARRDARRIIIREAVEYCASKPALHERVKALFWAEMSEGA
jgi:hypothetical protein